MKRSIRLLPLAVLLFAATAVFAQKDKVVASSEKRKPSWIGRTDASAFSVTEVGETLAAASERCMASIRQYVVNAVAVNVSSTETMTSRQITCDNLVSVLNDYSSVLMTEAGPLPYLTDLSLSNAEAVYWERIYSRKNKSYRYEYSVRYPFTAATRRRLVDAFLAVDDAKTARFERLRDESESLTNVDRIAGIVGELDALSQYFFDAVRKRDVETLRRNVQGLYSRISIEIESESPGCCVYSLRLDGRRVTTSVQPRLKSESAIGMTVSATGDGSYRLTYDAQYASPRDINTLEIRYPFGGGRISRTLYFDPPVETGNLQPN